MSGVTCDETERCNESDSDDSNEIDLFALQEGLSEETFAALLNFLPSRNFDTDAENDKESTSEKKKLAAERTAACVAYRAEDVNVIAETFKRLLIRTEEKYEKASREFGSRKLLLLEASTPELACQTLRDVGFVRLDNIVAPDLCDRMLSFINDKLACDIIRSKETQQDL